MTRGTCQKRAFTLLELLVVIGIIALLSTIGIGALRGFNAVNVVQAGNRQLLDDINRARNTAQNERTTVYMVFTPPLNTFLKTSLTNGLQLQAITNRFYGQYNSYNFIEMRTPGDQPGRGKARYLSEWKQLPNGVFIGTNEFTVLPPNIWLSQAALTNAANPTKPDMPFVYLSLPFPTANSPKVLMPCIAFNYRGALMGPDEDKARNVDEILVLTRGSMILPRDPSERPQFGPTAIPEIIETPRGNSTNNPYIRIDWITGRARLEGV